MTNLITRRTPGCLYGCWEPHHRMAECIVLSYFVHRLFLARLAVLSSYLPWGFDGVFFKFQNLALLVAAPSLSDCRHVSVSMLQAGVMYVSTHLDNGMTSGSSCFSAPFDETSSSLPAVYTDDGCSGRNPMPNARQFFCALSKHRCYRITTAVASPAEGRQCCIFRSGNSLQLA